MNRKFFRFSAIVTLTVFLIALACTLAAWFYIRSFSPDYSSEIQSDTINNDVIVHFDAYGVPHIEAQTLVDAQFALGYIHASERMFQMELLRRLAQGRMAEMAGDDLIKTDIFFRTLGLNKIAEKSALRFDSLQKSMPELAQQTKAYLNGINTWLKKNPHTLESRLTSITIDPFTVYDTYCITALMSFGFAEAYRIDPVVEQIAQRVSAQLLTELDSSIEHNNYTNLAFNGVELSKSVNDILNNLPVSPWIGSNSWVISGKHTASGKPLFCNDTHMGYQLPGVWYEAHIKTPDFEHYGNYLAGFPFPLVGHSPFAASGLTMFENDDTDFYFEQVEANQYRFGNEWLPLRSRTETIKIKNKPDSLILVNETHHGPLLNTVFDAYPTNKPFSVWCSFLKFPSKALETTYLLRNSKTIEDARKAASLLDAPGLNITFATATGDIAWWAAAKLFEKPAKKSGKRFLNGFSGNDELLPAIPFEKNPQCVNPQNGLIISANQKAETLDGQTVPGYYVPMYRANRIEKQLKTRSDWTVEAMKNLLSDDKGEEYAMMVKKWCSYLTPTSEASAKSINMIKHWDGNHNLNSYEPVLFYRWYYELAKETMADELGDSLFFQFMNTHWMKVQLPVLLNNEQNSWWDNVNTPQKETCKQIIQSAFESAISHIKKQSDNQPENLKWGDVHQLHLKHPFGNNLALNFVFNLKPQPVSGGNEVINNMGFAIDSTGKYNVTFGPAMRRIIDFAYPDSSWSVLPAGQSGIAQSKHYADQHDLFVKNKFRNQWMGKNVERNSSTTLKFKSLK
jgi:penicillin amidase